MAVHVLKVRGMTCDHCVQTLSKTLKATPGVHETQVDLRARTARVEHDDRPTGIGDLMAAVQRAGFEVEGFQTENTPASDPTR